MSTQTAPVDTPARTGNARLLHIADDTQKALCGAKVTRPAGGSDARKCVVCLDMASHGRFSAR